MDNNLDIQVESISDEQLNALMGDVPAKAGIDETLIVGSGAQLETEDEPIVETKKTTAKPKDKVVKTEPEVETEVDDSEAQIAELVGDETHEPVVGDNGTIFEAMAKGLVERGAWSDFQVPEDFEWTDEAYGELAQMQATWKAEEMFNEMVDETGDFGKTVFDHIRNGGDPNEIITIFKESKRIDNFDISSQEGKENIVREYYSKLGWTETKVNNFIKTLVDKGGLDEEAEDSKTLLGEAFNKEIELTRKQQEDYVNEQKRLEQEFSSNMTNAVKARKDIPEKERRELLDSILKYDQKLANGRVVNQFTLDFMKLQSDPQKYIDLIAFVRNPEKYIQKVTKEKETEVSKKTWNFIKGGGSLNRNTSSQPSKSSNKGSDLKIDYRI